MPGVEINGSSFTNKITSGNNEVYLSIKTKLIGTEGTRLLREMRVQGRPRRREASRRLTDRPRKASAWSGNQRPRSTTPQKKCRLKEFYLTDKTRLDYSSCFFTVILIGWKKFATLLPNYWLAETPQPLGEEAWQTVGGKGADF
ncbi:hypothetical protein P4576_03570 [Peribacillus frigoritolerans]|uniref:hypothetical protein n=1 Tax=Peribacillus frigoritolerans TaxID=450367 RepID=UPI002E1AF5FD|nr:hypothetical protein [Peribacillus frigoritolerans]